MAEESGQATGTRGDRLCDNFGNYHLDIVSAMCCNGL